MADLIITPPPTYSVGQTFGKWRVTRLYDFDGALWAEIVNTRNQIVSNRCPVADLEQLASS